MQKAQLTATQRDPTSANQHVKQPAQGQHTIINRACKESSKKQSKIASMPFASKAWPSSNGKTVIASSQIISVKVEEAPAIG